MSYSEAKVRYEKEYPFHYIAGREMMSEVLMEIHLNH